MNDENTRFTITLLKSDKERLEALATKQDRSESSLARRAIAAMLDAHDKRKPRHD